MFDVIVVGGGPAGSVVSLLLSEKGYKVAMFEEHQTPGFPMQCGGLISRDCLSILKNYIDIDKILLNKIEGAYFFSPSGKYVKLRGKSKAVVIDRKIMDFELFKLASSKVRTFVKTKVSGVLDVGGEYIVKAGNSFKSNYIVGADGPSSIVAKSLGFDRPDFLSAVQIECCFDSLDENFVELYFGYSDCMFAYSIPCGDGFSRIGVISRSNAIFWLKKLLKEHPHVSNRVKVKSFCELNCGAIPSKLVNFVKGNAVLIGDSAGMVKPYTGGGIYYLLVAAKELEKNFPNLDQFKKSYLRTLKLEYSFGRKIAKLYEVLGEEDYDYLISVANKIDSEKLHMDRPSSLVKVIPNILKLIKNRSLSLKLIKCLL